jgi:hypothetical protein
MVLSLTSEDPKEGQLEQLENLRDVVVTIGILQIIQLEKPLIIQ